MNSSGMPIFIVGYDRGPSGDRALTVAAEMACLLSARLHVVHVVTLMDYPVSPDAWDWEEQAVSALAAQRRQAEELLERLPALWTLEIRRGDAVSELVRAAEERDALLIVVGEGGRWRGFPHLVSPSVGRGVIRSQQYPVVVVPPPNSGTGSTPTAGMGGAAHYDGRTR